MAIRTFICIELPSDVSESLGRVIATVKPLGGRIAWVRPENIHLTLAFLGDVDEARIDDVNHAAAAAASGSAPFNLELGTFGVFSSRGRPRVFWAGIREQAGELDRLAANISRELSSAGFPIESRPFSPHLTLGRVKDDRDPAIRRVIDALAGMEPDRLAIAVDRVTVMRSELRPEGARYSHLGQVQLNG